MWYSEIPTKGGIHIREFQDLPRLRQTVDNTERYIYNML